MKRAMMFLAILGAMAWSPFAEGAEPPRIEFPTGHLVVTHGATKIEFLPDGSTKISNPYVTMTLPGRVNPDRPVNPPTPEPDDFVAAVVSTYGGLVEPGKKDSLTKLIAYYKEAQNLVPSAPTLGDLFGAMRSLPQIPAGEILPVRELLRDRMKSTLGTDPASKLDTAKTAALFSKFITALEACR